MYQLTPLITNEFHKLNRSMNVSNVLDDFKNGGHFRQKEPPHYN